ncbi:MULTISPECIES: hypothetical protein [Legionella]|uniref:Uncharacterized protein n=1 Tax=Legionella septentrionalis TaxID=2498109 RepID=A0A433JHH0_9GAMM|nr:MULTISPECIES: hypothetical protein [Legionella]MCP0914662.1 hypothetical protein [Legionella sp. 27cVA30]RUQ81621.1 hypothetical protein EKM59_10135 [Legionella septentrionalis]RUQ95734.1 hypothetical protein ELY11_08635 [Legionella septentrionalis]RUR15660.1 hypothetical protein ELY10_05570 [Legionella septentrionalis]
MGDFKSKLPSLKELGTMATKLVKDLKNSVDEIISDYKQKREDEEAIKPTAQHTPGETISSTPAAEPKTPKPAVDPVPPKPAVEPVQSVPGVHVEPELKPKAEVPPKKKPTVNEPLPNEVNKDENH